MGSGSGGVQGREDDESAALARAVSLKASSHGKGKGVLRALGLVGKGKSKSKTQSFSGPVSLDTPPELVSAPASSDEHEAGGGSTADSSDWEANSDAKRSPVLVRRRPATRDQGGVQQQQRPQGAARKTAAMLPLPGEDGDDVGLPPEIVYAGASQGR